MTRTAFLEELAEELELDQPLIEATNLKQLDSWDSMAAMIVIGYVSSGFGVTLTADDLKGIDTVHSLIARIGTDKFE
ncbi:phosphopantetheine-binding protein [Flavobacterium silvaticum]|uniref:Acyl carrier protein n=1 Tax=Flavobacterium silvaticum TaxID=1852020 RepID=A0A972JGX5_9FLAO|nr:phosphopantetheine-binding protein [Flavobacterium silvaticum]NMH29504.1 acyl carrier protein [Flavobacterium silvaticum]